MYFIYSLIVVMLLVLLFTKSIRNHAKIFYFIEYYALLLGAIDKFSALSQAQTEFIYQKNLNLKLYP